VWKHQIGCGLHHTVGTTTQYPGRCRRARPEAPALLLASSLIDCLSAEAPIDCEVIMPPARTTCGAVDEGLWGGHLAGSVVP